MSRVFERAELHTIEVFCACAQADSFAAAAMKLGLSAPAVSKAIGRLERRLGVKLFARTTRRKHLTAAGERYFTECRRALSTIGDVERELAGSQVQPSGRVRISVPTPLGQLRILPLLPEFRRCYPDVELDVQLSNRNVDFVAEGFDLAVRGRALPESDLIARHLLDAPLVVIAAPGYLAARGTPACPDDLVQHDCIEFLLPRTGQPVPWAFRSPEGDLDVAPRGGLRVIDDLLGGVTLCRHGGGLLQTYRFIVAEDLDRGELVEVLRDFAGRSRPFSLLFPRDAHMPNRVRVLIDFLMARLGPDSTHD